MEPRSSDALLRSVLSNLDLIPGWLTPDQATVLASEAAGASHVVEVGSYQGRSTVVLAAAVGPAGRVVAVDPFVREWRYGAEDTEQRLRTHLDSWDLAGRVDVRVSTSADVLRSWSSPVDLVYIDGKHDYWSTRHDLGWARWLPEGRTLLVHDAFSSVGVTLALARTLATEHQLRYVGRVGSLARLEVRRPTLRDRLRAARELPWWLRNIAVKLSLRLRARRVAGWLGHHDTADPY